MSKISETGMVTSAGQLLLPMDRVNAFLSKQKGRRIIAIFEAVEPGSSAAQMAYYFKYILPTIREALYETGERKTEAQTDLWLRGLCPTCWTAYGELMKIHEMSQTEMSDFIDWLKQFAAENLHVYIEDSRTI